jgi:hypothetical protein
MDDYRHPADMIIGPKATNQQGSLGKFGCTPRYVRLPHIHASRGGRGVPMPRPIAPSPTTSPVRWLAVGVPWSYYLPAPGSAARVPLERGE